MTRNDLILWFGRIATLVFTIAVFYDVYHDQHFSREIRIAVIATAGIVIGALFAWQVYVAQKYDGWPVIPFSFRWVVATWLGSMAVFIAWVVVTSLKRDIYTDLRSAIVYWQFATATLWFASRWVTVQTPHQAGIGETGTTPGNGAGPGGPTV